MGLFFNYDRPGPGVDKNAPKKKGVALYFELLGRNLSKLMLANLLYFSVSIPVVMLYYVIISMFLGNVMPDAVGSVGFMQLAVILTLLIVILWGTGPVSCGYTYILRNAAREEHTFLASDFFEKSRESFLYGLVFLIVDVVMLIAFSTSVLTYWSMSEKEGGIYSLLFIFTVVMLVMYTIMHFYLYEMEVTFEDGILNIYKNSFLMAFATMPMCLLLGAMICVFSFMALRFLMPIAIIFIAFICWVSFMRFIVDLYTSRVIKKNILSKYEETDEQKNS